MVAFTDRAIEARKLCRGTTRELLWDEGQPGLYLLISSASKTYRSRFRLNGKWLTRKLATYGEHVINEAGEAEPADVLWARAQTKRDRALVAAGIDPREREKPAATQTKTYGAVVDGFIEHYAKPRQRSWKQTENVLKRNCAAWLERPFDQVTRQDARTLLRDFIAKGHGPKAATTLAWLRTLWRWASEDEEIVPANIMRGVKIEFEKHTRDRFWTDDEVKAIWHAAEQLEELERANLAAVGIKDADTINARISYARRERDYIKLLMLLAPRKSALAGMRRGELDDVENPTLWITPHERVKARKTASKKRTYLTPLAPLPARILKGLLKAGDDFVFEGRTKAKPIWPGSSLQGKLVKLGAPADFNFHQARHTLATWFEDYSDFEVGLLLNHTGGGNVTAGYRHSHALKLKLTLLTEWADHIERLVQPSEGVALLR